MKKNIAVTIVAGLAALGLTACGADAEVAGGPVATATVTAEASPAPTVTVTETPEPVVETVEVAPQACIDAINKSEELIQMSLGMTELAAEYIPLVSEAYEAGVTGYGHNEVIAQMEDLNTQVGSVDPSGLRADLDSLTVECFAASGDGA